MCPPSGFFRLRRDPTHGFKQSVTTDGIWLERSQINHMGYNARATAVQCSGARGRNARRCKMADDQMMAASRHAAIVLNFAESSMSNFRGSDWRTVTINQWNVLNMVSS